MTINDEAAARRQEVLSQAIKAAIPPAIQAAGWSGREAARRCDINPSSLRSIQAANRPKADSLKRLEQPLFNFDPGTFDLAIRSDHALAELCRLLGFSPTQGAGACEDPGHAITSGREAALPVAGGHAGPTAAATGSVGRPSRGHHMAIATYRDYWLGAGQDGFALTVVDRRAIRHLGEILVEGTLSALGHPCCGLGAGRLPFVHAPASALLYGVLEWAFRGDRQVARIPLTEDQARAIDPEFVARHLAEDDEDDT